MSIKMIRLDDRLIHGQIVTAWAKNQNINRIWIIDNGVSKDAFIKNVMQMVAPADTELVITGEDEIKELVEKFDNDPEKTLILVKYPYVAQKVFQAGIEIKAFNIGGMGAGPGRKKLYKNISASQKEVDTLSEIAKSGIDVYFQVTPNERRIDFETKRGDY